MTTTTMLKTPNPSGRFAVKSYKFTVISGLIILALALALIYAPIGREVKGGLALVMMLAMILVNIPVAISMGITGAIGLLVLGGPRAIAGLLGDIPFSATATSTMSVLPMFILMGLILWRSGITSDLYIAAKHWIAWLPGGLAVTTNVAGAGLGAASGSTMGIAYALGRIGIPEMLKAGYDKKLAIGAVMSSGTIAQLIPPSLLLVVYAGFTEVPVGQQLMAGILPGVILTLAYCSIIIGIAVVRPKMAPRDTNALKVPLTQKIADTVKIWPVVAIVVIVIGGMSSGIFTATEAGAVGALASILFSVTRVGFKPSIQITVDAARDTLVSVGSLLFILIGATLLNRFLALSGAAQLFADYIRDLGLSPVLFIVVLVIFHLILGMFLDPIPMMLLTVPLLLPTAIELGYSPIWYGVFIVLLSEIAIMSPPVGVLAFVVHRIAQNKEVNLGQRISIIDVYTAALYFIPGALMVIALLTAWPMLGDFPTFLKE